MKFREHRGSLDDSMKTLKTFNSRAELVAWIAALYAPYDVTITNGMVEILPYYMKLDKRTGWDSTYMVRIKTGRAIGIAGFTDERY